MVWLFARQLHLDASAGLSVTHHCANPEVDLSQKTCIHAKPTKHMIRCFRSSAGSASWLHCSPSQPLAGWKEQLASRVTLLSALRKNQNFLDFSKTGTHVPTLRQKAAPHSTSSGTGRQRSISLSSQRPTAAFTSKALQEMPTTYRPPFLPSCRSRQPSAC